MRQSAVSFEANGLKFEGILSTPDDLIGDVPGVVVCHPHPLFGGNMHNNVVSAVTYHLSTVGIATLKFNFRGVGNSEGEHSKGELEYQEVVAAQKLLSAWPGINPKKIGIVGYSFGTRVILRHPQLQKSPRAFAFISPSIEALEESTLKNDKRPKFVISGTKDKLLQSAKLPEVLEQFVNPPMISSIEGADHFWANMEDLAVEPVSTFFHENLT